MEKIEDNFEKDFAYCELSEEYLEKTISLLVSEWPRSTSQRGASLRHFLTDKSDKNFFDHPDKHSFKLPISLIFISKKEDTVVGHASLLQIATSNKQTGIEYLTYLQSLVIDKNLRGKGLGKKLMRLSEQYINEYEKRSCLNAEINCDFLYLTTKDQCIFYESCGYRKMTHPIHYYPILDKNSKTNQIILSLLTKQESTSTNDVSINKNGNFVPSNLAAPPLTALMPISALSSPCPSLPPPPPPPPPLLSAELGKKTQISKETNSDSISTTWYKKYIKK